MQPVNNDMRGSYPMAIVIMALLAMYAIFSTCHAESRLHCSKEENCFTKKCSDKCRDFTPIPERSYCTFTHQMQCCCPLADSQGLASAKVSYSDRDDINIIGSGGGRSRGDRCGGQDGGFGAPRSGHGGAGHDGGSAGGGRGGGAGGSHRGGAGSSGGRSSEGLPRRGHGSGGAGGSGVGGHRSPPGREHGGQGINQDGGVS